MSESSLTLGYSELLAETGQYLGYGKGADFGHPAWSIKQRGELESIVESGLRQAYHPPPLPGEASSYEWSFLKPTATITLASSESVAPLPDDFGGFDGELTLTAASSMNWWALPISNEGFVRHRHSISPTTTGRPQMAAVEWIKGTTGKSGQRAQLVVWPLADTEYTFRCPYYFHPRALTESLPFHLGGMGLSELVLESCLAIAEQRLDDTAGIHTMKFMERLAASISTDRRMKPQLLGYNRDLSDFRDRHPRGRWNNFDGVTVNGTQY